MQQQQQELSRLLISRVVPMALTRPLSSTKHMPKRREPAMQWQHQ
jgi:hypothetical protein